MQCNRLANFLITEPLLNTNQIVRLLRPLLYRRGTRKWAIVLIAAVVGYSVLQPYVERQFGWQLPSIGSSSSRRASHSAGGPLTVADAGALAITNAFERKQSNVVVECEFDVIKLLRDDNEGSRHQKMLLQLPATSHTVLLAHNIDLAPRVPAREGDKVIVRGEYEYSDKGGVVHWTHHDPRGKHPAGWIEHQGKRYE